jgi:hypothetical protein
MGDCNVSESLQKIYGSGSCAWSRASSSDPTKNVFSAHTIAPRMKPPALSRRLAEPCIREYVGTCWVNRQGVGAE